MDPNALDAKIKANPGADDAALLTLCAADPRTVRGISLDDLRPLLGVYEVLGSMQLGAMDPAASIDTRRKLLNGVSYLQSGKRLSTDQPAEAAKVDELLTDLHAAGALPDDAVAAILALGGGYAVRDATADDVAASRRRLAIAAVSDTLTGLVPRFFRERLTDTSPVPTLADFKAFVAAL